MRAVLGPGRLAGEVAAPASKSDAHRCLVAAALADGDTAIAGLGGAEDVRVTIACLTALGARVEGGVVHPVKTPAQTALLTCGESGTTLRLMLPLAAALGVTARCVGSGRLPGRPIKPLVDTLNANGAGIVGEAIPLTVQGRLRSGQYLLPGDVSSQFVTGLLLALPLLEGDSEIRLEGPLQSAGYVDMTLGIMRRFGVSATVWRDSYYVSGGQRYQSPGTWTVEGDWSSAAFYLAAGAIGGEITVTGLSAHSLQPDRRIVPLLRKFGAHVVLSGDTVHVRREAMHGMEANVSDVPDLVPALVVMAACAQGATRLTGVARLRHKESDRLEALCAMLGAMGGHAAVEADDTLVITGGGPLHGGVVDGCNDHRIVMAASVLAQVCTGPTTITGVQAVRKSHPAFFDEYRRLGGQCDVVDDR